MKKKDWCQYFGSEYSQGYVYSSEFQKNLINKVSKTEVFSQFKLKKTGIATAADTPLVFRAEFFFFF